MLFFVFRVPDAVVLKKHVLVMSFIGEDGRPAPKLKDAVEHMTRDMVNKAYAQLEETMVSLPLIFQQLIIHHL